MPEFDSHPETEAIAADTCESCCDSAVNQRAEPTSSFIFGQPGEWISPVTSFLLLATGLILDHFWTVAFFEGPLRLLWYILAYLPVARPVLQKGFVLLKKGDVFTEFFLMSIATIGAFLIGEYPEAVAVMLFYTIGELFQENAVRRAKFNIHALLNVQADIAHLEMNGSVKTINPRTIAPGSVIQIKPGEKVPLDGELLSESGSFNTSALTGESIPGYKVQGDTVLSGMVNQDSLIRMRVTKPFDESAISKILELIQNASSRKAKTEEFIRRFSRIYTPAVTFLAALLVTVPVFFADPYVFSDWLYRGLVFLVISCPCALVISIPLGYFGGIGAASKNGILFKGANFLDRMPSVNTLVVDKTGTLTKGQFAVEKIVSVDENQDWLFLAAAAEQKSSHPIAKAVTSFAEQIFSELPPVESMREISGLGIIAVVNDKKVTAGNKRLLELEGISLPVTVKENDDTIVSVAVDGQYKGHVVISDTIKKDTRKAIADLRKNGIRHIVMLSGDRSGVVKKVAGQLGIETAIGELHPEQKVQELEKLLGKEGYVVAYAGDGINDAPSLALSDVGIAMGAMGSDAAIESADVVIQTDQPSKIVTSLKIGRATKKIVWQNVVMALGVKGAILITGAMGMASLWGAVFADVGVALLAVLNAVRIQSMKF